MCEKPRLYYLRRKQEGFNAVFGNSSLNRQIDIKEYEKLTDKSHQVT